ncbi:hypothetical protein [Yersinia mollaretii]|uniref:hypothetical protein n=1 Tax=Yersinia mollaretii TaxID=33060 RepID=UPI0011A975DB|nr:hypothetical protein [Yersinia mollaretii]
MSNATFSFTSDISPNGLAEELAIIKGAICILALSGCESAAADFSASLKSSGNAKLIEIANHVDAQMIQRKEIKFKS